MNVRDWNETKTVQKKRNAETKKKITGRDHKALNKTKGRLKLETSNKTSKL